MVVCVNASLHPGLKHPHESERVLISSPPPWAQSGYGGQARLAAETLLELGHQVAISAFAGVHEEQDWHGIRILPTGGKSYGNGLLAGNYRRWDADVLILICDPWAVEPAQFAGLHVMPWMPVDTDELGVMNARWLETAYDVAASVRPVAMSEHGRRCLEMAGWPAVPVVQHVVDGRIEWDEPAGKEWRKSLHIPADGFLIGKVGVNDGDDRKALTITLHAFAEFARKRKNAFLYLHTEPQVAKAPNLAYIAMQLGLKGRVAFADDFRRAADLFTVEEMSAIYNGCDVMDQTSRAEGFGVPVVEALACGTPVIGCRNSAVTEKIKPGWGWLVSSEPCWAPHHHAWWSVPRQAELVRAYESAYNTARSKRAAAHAAGGRYRGNRDAWEAALASPARPADHGKTFRAAYSSGQWGHGSGPGSDPFACHPYIQLVEKFIAEHGIGSVTDLGCGDGQLARAIDWQGADYIGLDVVTGHDIRTCELPPAGLALIKDVFQHWSNVDIAAFAIRLQAFDRVLITNTVAEQITGRPLNSDIAAGQWRAVDVTAPPFSWPGREILRWELPGETKSVVLLTGGELDLRGDGTRTEIGGTPDP